MPLVGEIPPPPARTRAAKNTTAAPRKLADVKPTDTTLKAKRVETLNGYGQIAQAICLMFGQFADAETIDIHGGPVYSAVADLGDHHEGFGASLDKADAMGPYLALGVAAIPIVMQFAANHGRIDATVTSLGGVVPPAQLADRKKAKLMRAQAEALRAQREAQQAAAQAEQELREEIQAMQQLTNQQAAGV